MRADRARDDAVASGVAAEYDQFSDDLQNLSTVVVAVPAWFAQRLTVDPRTIYTNYDLLVGAGGRLAASPENDTVRSTIGSYLFGHYKDKIVYGALSLNGSGLATYGDIYCRLRSVTVEDRVSFLESNSYEVVFGRAAGTTLPPGLRAVWDNRHQLALAKLESRLNAGMTSIDLASLLIVSDGMDRSHDDFIEAHIYGPFNIEAVETMEIQSTRGLDREAKMDAEIAIEKFSQRHA